MAIPVRGVVLLQWVDPLKTNVLSDGDRVTVDDAGNAEHISMRRADQMLNCRRKFGAGNGREHLQNLPRPNRTFELGRIASDANRLILHKTQAEY